MSNIDELNSLLRGEKSATETYEQALEKVNKPLVRRVLHDCLQSHAQRVPMLEAEIVRQGGQPAQDSGVWGTFAKASEGLAKLAGEKAAVSMLEEGEDHGLKTYKESIDKLDDTSSSFIKAKIYPMQVQTHDSMSRLQNVL